jgi:hypothetical protein
MAALAVTPRSGSSSLVASLWVKIEKKNLKISIKIKEFVYLI